LNVQDPFVAFKLHVSAIELWLHRCSLPLLRCQVMCRFIH